MTRQISWVRAARKDFEKFPQSVQERMIEVLDLVSGGSFAAVWVAGFTWNQWQVSVEYEQGNQNPKTGY